MNIIRRELKSNFKSRIIWSVSMILLIIAVFIEFSAFRDSPEINDVLNSFPDSVLSALGMGDADMTTLSGFLSLISLYIYLPLSIHASLLGSSIISKEERDKTAEFLFTLPVSRKKAIVNKIISSILEVINLNFLTALTIVIMGLQHNPDGKFYKFLLLLFLGIFLTQLIFLSIGIFIASITKRYKKSGNISLTILFVTYIISVLIGLTDKIDFLKYITPFEYFKSSYILENLELKLVYIVISFIIISISMIGTFKVYPKRDLYI